MPPPLPPSPTPDLSKPECRAIYDEVKDLEQQRRYWAGRLTEEVPVFTDHLRFFAAAAGTLSGLPAGEYLKYAGTTESSG